jgi:modulator of FtsH protease
MDPIDLEGWHDFAVASAGAAGALAGLIIVAMSVNIKEIVQGSALPARSGATIGSVVVIVVASVAILIPSQWAVALGLELVLFALGALALQFVAIRQMLATPEGGSRRAKLGDAVLGYGQLLPIAAGGVLVALGNPAGLFFVAAGFVAIFIVSVLNAWVLMVEILR